MKQTFTCQNCGAEADMTVEGLEGVADVIDREKTLRCQTCGEEIEMAAGPKETYACQHCGAEADMTLEGFESVADVLRREKKLTCGACGKDVSWTEKEDVKAVKMAMEAELEASQFYAKASKKTKNAKGRDMFQQLSEFEMNHYRKLKELLQSLRESGEWILYEGSTLKKRTIPLRMDKQEGQDQLSDMDALRMAVREEKKAQTFYRSMAGLIKDQRGRDMYRRLADEEALHEKVLNDQFYSLHNTGIWSWGD